MPKIKKIILSALLLAIMIVLVRFVSIKTPIIRISAGFVPLMLAAVWLGPKWAALIGCLADLVGATLFPSGPYFPGYTLSSIISGTIYGLILYKDNDDSYTDKQFIGRLIVSTVLVIIIVNVFMNTLWIYLTTKEAVKIIIPIRIVKQLIMLPIQVITIYVLEKTFRKPFNQYIRSRND